MNFEWCIGTYEGERAKSVLDHAYAGLGYFIRRQEGSGRGLWVEAAFRRPIDSLRPESLHLADPIASMKLDNLWVQRHGVTDRSLSVRSASAETIASIRNIVKLKKK